MGPTMNLPSILLSKSVEQSLRPILNGSKMLVDWGVVRDGTNSDSYIQGITRTGPTSIIPEPVDLPPVGHNILS